MPVQIILQIREREREPALNILSYLDVTASELQQRIINLVAEDLDQNHQKSKKTDIVCFLIMSSLLFKLPCSLTHL